MVKSGAYKIKCVRYWDTVQQYIVLGIFPVVELLASLFANIACLELYKYLCKSFYVAVVLCSKRCSFLDDDRSTTFRGWLVTEYRHSLVM